MSCHSVEGDGDGDETGSRQEDHEHGVSDRVEFSAPFPCQDVANAIHGVDFWVITLEETNNVSRPCG